MLSCLFLAAFWSPAGKGWPLGSFVCCVFLCFCHFPIRCSGSWVRCGTWWYQFLIFASSLLLSNINQSGIVNFSAAMIAVNVLPCIRIVLDILEHALYPYDLNQFSRSSDFDINLNLSGRCDNLCIAMDWSIIHYLGTDFQITLAAEYVLWCQTAQTLMGSLMIASLAGRVNVGCFGSYQCFLLKHQI